MKFPDITPPTSGFKNIDLSQKAMKLDHYVRLMDGYGPWTAVTRLRNTIQHKDPEIRKMLQSNIDEAGMMMMMGMYFSLWDSCFVPVDMSSVYQRWMTEEQETRFKAFKHVRHSCLHDLTGKRADRFRVEFESVMTGPRAFKGIIFDVDTIDISESQVHFDCRVFFMEIARQLLGRLVNDNPMR